MCNGPWAELVRGQNLWSKILSCCGSIERGATWPPLRPALIPLRGNFQCPQSFQASAAGQGMKVKGRARVCLARDRQDQVGFRPLLLSLARTQKLLKAFHLSIEWGGVSQCGQTAVLFLLRKGETAWQIDTLYIWGHFFTSHLHLSGPFSVDVQSKTYLKCFTASKSNNQRWFGGLPVLVKSSIWFWSVPTLLCWSTVTTLARNQTGLSVSLWYQVWQCKVSRVFYYQNEGNELTKWLSVVMNISRRLDVYFAL